MVSCNIVNEKKEGMMFSQEYVLKKIHSDVSTKGDFYFCPGNAETDYVGGKIHVFWDDLNWAIVFEAIHFDFYSSAIVSDLLPFYGDESSLLLDKDFRNYFSKGISDEENLKDLFGDDFDYLIKDDLKLSLNEAYLILPNRMIIKDYLKKEASNYDIKVCSPEAVMRYLIDLKPDVIYSTEKDIKQRLNIDMERKMEILEWEHKEINWSDSDPKLSFSNSMFNIARCIEDRSTSLYDDSATIKNTHWRNWTIKY